MLERYTGSEPEVLQKLVEQINKLQASDLKKSKMIDRVEKELDETKVLARPNTIVLDSKTIEKIESGYRVRLLFKPSKTDVALGRLDFSVEIPIDSDKDLLSLEPCGPSAMVQIRISVDKKAGHIVFTPLSDPCLMLRVSGSTKVQIKGNLDLNTFVFDIEKEL